jgi:hypothetical protein
MHWGCSSCVGDGAPMIIAQPCTAAVYTSTFAAAGTHTGIRRASQATGSVRDVDQLSCTSCGARSLLDTAFVCAACCILQDTMTGVLWRALPMMWCCLEGWQWCWHACCRANSTHSWSWRQVGALSFRISLHGGLRSSRSAVCWYDA